VFCVGKCEFGHEQKLLVDREGSAVSEDVFVYVFILKETVWGLMIWESADLGNRVLCFLSTE
jgi:hypothetical protein